MTIRPSSQPMRPRLWPYRLTVIVVAFELCGALYFLFGRWAVATTVSGGTPQVWLFALTLPLVLLYALLIAALGCVACVGMPNWRDRSIAALVSVAAVAEFIALRNL